MRCSVCVCVGGGRLMCFLNIHFGVPLPQQHDDDVGATDNDCFTIVTIGWWTGFSSQVGSWTWNWMEPPLGQISFFLLCLQWARNQMLNVQVKPYTSWMVGRRAQSLIDKYPQYSQGVTKDFAETDM